MPVHQIAPAAGLSPRAAQLLRALQETFRRYQAGYMRRDTCRAHLAGLWAHARAEGLTGALIRALTDPPAEPAGRPRD